MSGSACRKHSGEGGREGGRDSPPRGRRQPAAAAAATKYRSCQESCAAPFVPVRAQLTLSVRHSLSLPLGFGGFGGNSLERSRKRKILSGPFILRVKPSCAIFTSTLKLEPLWDFSCCAYLLAAFLHDISEPKDGRRDRRASFQAPGNRRVQVEDKAGLTLARLG